MEFVNYLTILGRSLTNQYEIISVQLDSVLTFLARRNFHARSRASLALISFTDENSGTTRSLTGICSTKFLSSLRVSSSSPAAIFKRARAIHTFYYP